MKEKKTEKPAGWEEEVWESSPLMERSHLKKDTYFECWCPHCGKGLNEGDRAVFEIVNNRGEKGISKVASYLNVLQRESSIQVEDDEELAGVFCPHCHTSMIEPNKICKQDKCKMVSLNVSVSNSKKMRMIFCVRQTCRWYEMSDEDNERLILRDSHEW